MPFLVCADKARTSCHLVAGKARRSWEDAMTADAVNKQVGSQVREARRRAGLTQSALAERAGIAFETVSRIERGTLNTTVRTLLAIAEALGVEPGALLVDGDVRPAQLDDSLQAVIDPLLGETDATREVAARLVRALVGR